MQICRHKQRGAALLLLLLVLILTGTTIIVSKYSANKSSQIKHANTSGVLAKAKEALIAFAVTSQDTNNGLMGFLPCPEISLTIFPEGSAAGTCGARYESSIGRLPWRTLGIDALKDSAGACLWYAVSAEFKNSGSIDRDVLSNPPGGGFTRSEMLNEDTNGLFTLFDENLNQLNGNTPEDRVVAVIFAPGQALSGQNRGLPLENTQCGGDYNPVNFLDNFNGIDNSTVTTGSQHALDSFITASRANNSNLNDRVITITQREIFDAIRQRGDFSTSIETTTEALARCIAAYGSESDNQAGNTGVFRLPWPAALNIGGVDYRDSTAYIEDTANTFGRFPVDVTLSNGRTGNANQYLLEGTLCNAITVNSNIKDLTTDLVLPRENSEERRIWQNWKDHFFYVVSPSFASNVANSVTPSTCTAANCISVDGNLFAAAVFYSHEIRDNQIRTMQPTDPDTKGLISNYLEGDNINGDNIYETNLTNSVITNDLAFCIDATMNVSNCQ